MNRTPAQVLPQQWGRIFKPGLKIPGATWPVSSGGRWGATLYRVVGLDAPPLGLLRTRRGVLADNITLRGPLAQGSLAVDGSTGVVPPTVNIWEGTRQCAATPLRHTPFRR